MHNFLFEFKFAFHLKIVVRQHGLDQDEFRNLLKNVELPNVTISDWYYLKQRSVDFPPNDLDVYLFVKNKDAKIFTMIMFGN